MIQCNQVCVWNDASDGCFKPVWASCPMSNTNVPDTNVGMTNGDRIRAMTDEELAEWLENGVSSDSCDYCEFNNGYCDGLPCRGKADTKIIEDWLKRPAEEEA